MTPPTQLDLCNRTGNSVRLGSIVGQGGEAIVYGVAGEPQQLAKIYRQTPNGYEVKLTWMVGHPPVQSGAHVEMAWPTELLFDESGALMGFLMPRIVGAVPILMVFNPRKRTQLLPNFDLRYRYRAARNLAAAVQAAHDAGYVIGDLNESNALVSSTALITLLDTDSFQVRVPHGKSTRTFRSPVGKPEYTPPELQGLHFQSVDRTPAHDRFALGVLIYQLLMDGNHPFRLLWRGSGDPPSLEDSIRQGWFPYAAAPPMIAPPPHAPGFDTLDTSLAALARRCFVEGHRNPELRPTAADWQRALGTSETSLRTCKAGHLFAGKTSACPVCAAQSKATRVKPKKKPHRSKTPRTTQTSAPIPPPPFNALPKPQHASSPSPTPSPYTTLPKKKTNWMRWIFFILVVIWIWNNLAGNNGTTPVKKPADVPRATATARAASVRPTRTPAPLNFTANRPMRTWEFTDPFLDPSDFSSVRSAAATAEIADGVFNASVLLPDAYYAKEYLDDPISSNENFGTSVSIEQSDGVGEIFLRFLSQPSGDQWYFAVNPGESSWLLYHDSAMSEDPFVWVAPRSINRLDDLENISVEIENGAPTFFVNGTNVVPTSVNMPRITGNLVVGFGLHAAPEVGATMEAHFDDFRVYAK